MKRCKHMNIRIRETMQDLDVHEWRDGKYQGRVLVPGDSTGNIEVECDDCSKVWRGNIHQSRLSMWLRERLAEAGLKS